MMRGRWVRGVASILAGLVLVAVPVLGISRLGGEVLSSWGSREGNPGEVSFVKGLSSLSPLTFEAPAATVRATQEKAQRSLARANLKRERVTDLRDWTFTQTDAQRQRTIHQLQHFLALEERWYAYGQQFVLLALENKLSSDQIAFALLQPFIQIPGFGPSPGVGTQLILDFIIARAIGAEPLVDLVLRELYQNAVLLQQGVPLPLLIQVIGYETLVNMQVKMALLQLLQQPPPSPSQ